MENSGNAAMNFRDVNDAAEHLQRTASARVIHFFSIPEDVVKLTGIKEVGMVELTAGEELLATERSRGSNMRLGTELVKESWRRVDGRSINTGDGSVDAIWDRQAEGMSYLRQFLLAGYNDIHNPKVDDMKAFLKSRRAQV